MGELKPVVSKKSVVPAPSNLHALTHLGSAVGVWALTLMLPPSPLLWIVRTMFYLKFFIIMHDCIHGSFVPSVKLNRRLASWLDFIIITPSDYWRRGHLRHHNIQGRTDKIDWSATIMFNTSHMRNWKPWQRRAYLLFRFPPLFFFLTPLLVWWFYYLFLFPSVLSLLGHVGLIAYAWLMQPANMGFWWHLLYCESAPYMAGLLGVVLFHIQHSANLPGFQVPEPKHTRKKAAVRGSADHPVPWPINFFTMGIQRHHFHHYDTQIPGYFLESFEPMAEMLDEDGLPLTEVQRMNYKQVAECLWNIAWDEKKQRYLSWHEAMHDLWNYQPLKN